MGRSGNAGRSSIARRADGDQPAAAVKGVDRRVARASRTVALLTVVDGAVSRRPVSRATECAAKLYPSGELAAIPG